MSDSTIDDALRLLESGKGSPDRLKRIIETFEQRSLISLQDRKYVEALVQQYLTPRHRIKIKKIEPIKKQPSITPRTLKSTKPEFSFERGTNTSDDKINLEKSELESPIDQICPECNSQNSASNNFCNNCGSRMTKSDTGTTKPASSNITKNESEFESAKKKITEKIAGYANKVREKQIPLSELAFNVMISKSPAEYVKTVPQHIRAAKQLESIREIKKGDIISYVKILNKPGVKPVEMARQDEIDSSKYMEFMESTLEQITSSMDLDFDTILGKPKQTGLDQFFWN